MPAPLMSRPRTRPRRWATLVGSAALLVGAASAGDDASNRDLLETLPRDRRVALAEDLARFDALPAAQQTAIRRLDATIAAADPDEQARYRALVQHYHSWFQGLTEEQRTTLLAIDDPAERFRQARQLRLATNTRGKRGGIRVSRLRTGAFGLVGPYEMATLLRAWLALPPEKRAEIDRKPFPQVRDTLRAEAKTLKIRPEVLAAEQERAYDAQLEADLDFRPLVEAKINRVEKAVAKGQVAKKAENDQKRYEHPFAEFLFFEDHPPRPVAPAQLERFGAACPEWLRLLTDSLSGDDARDYYTILYRLVEPDLARLPEPSRGAIRPAAVTPPKGTSGPSAPSNPTL